ncbi:MAG: response regulator [Candidatus Omnitrophica bacterium]|nr:response regulator [Candidatus Omnitrophota bacterium]
MLNSILGFFRRNTNMRKAAKRVLVVDDNATDRKLLCGIVKRAGHDCIFAEGGLSAISLAKTHRPDMILLDCDMPDMNGLDVCKKIKDMSELKACPIVFVTSNTTPKNVIDCFEAQAENYLSKPISAKLLINQMKELLYKNENVMDEL